MEGSGDMQKAEDRRCTERGEGAPNGVTKSPHDAARADFQEVTSEALGQRDGRTIDLGSHQEQRQALEGIGTTHPEGAAYFPRVIMAVRPEKSSVTTGQRHAQMGSKSATVNTASKKLPLRTSVSLQTEASWLYEQGLQNQTPETHGNIILPADDLLSLSDHEEDLYSSLSDGLSELSILCDMEFSSDYFAFFEQPLRTLLSIGPPAILAYKRESSEDERLHAMMQTLREQSENEECEFCGKPLKPLPMPDMGVSGADKTSSAEQFCCTQYKNVCEFLFKEQKHIFNKDGIETISITPHAPFGSEVERKKAKEKTAQRLRERQMAKMFASVEKEPTTSYTEYGKPMKTLSYQLSNAPPVGDNWTIVPDSAAPDSVTNGYFGPKSVEWTSDVNTMDPELTCYDFTIHEEKMMPAQFTEKYYKNGKTFLMVFPDGTTQIFYPSGNLAINVIASKGKETICIVQEDKENNADILAVLSSYGKATCYHPNGVVWININPVGGQYLDLTGRRIKRWKWKNDAFSNNSVIFKPIFISLNNQVGVRILSKEKILVTFLAMGKQAKFNIGSKSQTKQVEENETRMQLKKDISEDELILFAIKIKILSLLNKLHDYLNFPSNMHWHKIKAPAFLLSQTQKLRYLCSVCNINKEVNSSVMAIIDN